MKKIKSFRVDTKIGNGTLDIFEKNEGGYFAEFHGLSGLAHVKSVGATPLAANIDFTFGDTSYNDIIEKCRSEIETRDSEILNFDPI